jgi:thiamine-phosphate pyrophosphorylase
MLIKGLYAVTPDTEDSGALCRKVLAVLTAGVRLIQYRNKSASPAQRAAQALELTALCRRFDACLIVNDDPDLAALCSADGVHLGADDTPVAQARRILGPGALIGVSCYSNVERAMRAAAEGADHVAFGSFFRSATKPRAQPAALSLLAAAAACGLPIVAIGGITAQNAGRVIEAGADAVAVVNGLFGAPDIESEGRRLLDVVAAALARQVAEQAAS